jgi:2-polyprenyl-3-methyl-5-hydroxy-6-metoxy-1,4-benzoquinol methylase
MAQIAENLAVFDQTYKWEQEGEEWSERWGSAEAQWWGTLLPRLHAFLPAGRILEIAPGHGRWTQFLKDLCDQLEVVDLSPRCIETCKAQFAASHNITYHVNDGKSLDMIADRSIDLMFSFDSLVHAGPDVIKDYLRQLAHKLRPNGIGFLHHSNLGAYQRRLFLESLLERYVRPRRLLNVFGPPLSSGYYWRCPEMTADLFQTYCGDAGLCCIHQEVINWVDTKCLIDCLSLFTPKDSIHVRRASRLHNPQFMDEGKMTQRQAAYMPHQRTMS